MPWYFVLSLYPAAIWPPAQGDGVEHIRYGLAYVSALVLQLHAGDLFYALFNALTIGSLKPSMFVLLYSVR